MKEIYNEYKESFKYFFYNKKYIISIIVIAILSYGFILTHFTVGIDDLCFDRYLNKGYWLATDRWGAVAIYKILGITKFTPIWLESIVVILTIFMAIVLCSFIKKNLKVEIKDIEFILFSGILISTPMLYIQLLYQTSSLTNIVSNFALIIIAMIFYENFHKSKNKIIYCIGIVVMPLFISMYEACCQTYVVFVLIIAFISLVNGEKAKEVLKWIGIALGLLLFGIIFNILIVSIIKIVLKNKLPKDFAYKGILWLEKPFKESIQVLCYVLISIINYIKSYIYLIIIGLCTSAVIAIKKNNLLYLFLYIGIIIANILINLMQLKFLLRIDTSWAITVAFMIMYLLIIPRKNKYIYLFATILSIFILLHQTQKINNNFYNDYIEYEKIKTIAFDIAEKINKNIEDDTKPIIYIYKDYIKNYKFKVEEVEIGQGENLINWSSYAFEEPGVEMTKFINSLGYNFYDGIITVNEYKESIKKYKEIDDKEKQQDVMETDEYIYVKI